MFGCCTLLVGREFAVVPLGVSCFLSCRVRGYFVARWKLERRQVVGSCSGGREPVAWVQMQSSQNRHLLVFSK